MKYRGILLTIIIAICLGLFLWINTAFAARTSIGHIIRDSLGFLLPANSSDGLGTSTSPWSAGYFTDLYVSGTCTGCGGEGGGSGTVTSVALTTPTGLSVSGSPITTSGTLALSLTGGYVIPLTASTTDWQTAFGWGNHASQNYFDKDTDTTTNITEGSKLFYTDARARQSISETVTGIDYNNSTGVFTNTSGYTIPLTASTTDWQTAFGWGNHASAGYLTGITGQSIQDLNDVANMTEATGDVLSWNGSTWTNVATSSLGLGGVGGSGTVNSGTAGQGAFYASTGTAVSGLSDILYTENAGVPGTYNMAIGTTTDQSVKLRIQPGDPDDALEVFNEVGERVFFINSSGDNVAIAGGATAASFTPDAMLQLYHSFTSIFNPSRDVGTSANYPLILQNAVATNASSTGIGFTITNTANNIGAAIIAQRTGSNSQANLQFYTKQSTTGGADPAEGFRLSEAGNVLIATTTGADRLNVVGDINYTGALKTNGSAGTSGHVLQSTGTGTQWVATSSLGISGGSSQWTTSGSDIYYNTGDVGIGASSPTYKLQVEGGTANSTMFVRDTTATTGKTRVIIQNGAANSVSGTSEAPFNIYNNAGNQTAFIRGDGYIAGTIIGTSDDQTVVLSQTDSPAGVHLKNTGMISFSSTASWWGGKDLGLYRNAAGVLEINSGSAGTLRDLTARAGTFTQADNGTALTVAINATQANVTGADTFIDFRSTTGSEGSIAGTGSAGVIAYNTFTGSHYTQVVDKTDIQIGMVLDSIDEKADFSTRTREVYKTVTTGGLTEAEERELEQLVKEANAKENNGDVLSKIRITQLENKKKTAVESQVVEIATSTASGKSYLPKSEISTKQASKAVYGVYGGTDKEGRDMVFSLGTGIILVTNKGDDIEVGDYLMTSNVKGHAEKQADDICRNITVAKARESVTWSAGEKSRLIAVTYKCE